MFNRYFYQKFIIYGVNFNLGNVLVSLGWTVGLPFMVIAFVLPIVILNELTIKWTGNVIQRTAKGMGANDVQFQRVEKIQASNFQEPTEPEVPSEPKERIDI
jgi:hypothetical protein